MKYIKSLYTAIVVLLLTACQSEQWEGLEGGFIVSLEEEVTVSTKSTPAELGKPDPELFKLKIVKESNGNTLYDGNFTGKTIPASAGLYTLTATCGDNPILALDAPYYKGEESGIEVTEGETTPVELKCSVANALTSVIYDEPEKFNDLYSSYALKIAVGNQSVTIGPSQTYKSAYYQAGTIPVFQFVGTLKDNGQEVSTTLDDERLKDAATFAAGKHCKLTLKVKPTESGVILTVDKVEVETVSISETIPVEWLPKPKIDGFENGQTSLTYTETTTAIPAQLKFTGSQAIQDVEFSFNFQDLQEKFQALNNKTFLLSQLSEEDRTLLNAASIILPSLDRTNTGLFDFTAMTSSLQTLAGGADAVNTINLRVKANNRWSSEEPTSYQIITTKPIFHVSVYPGNIWTKEFTMNHLLKEEVESGDYSKLSSNMMYQFSTNNKDWNNLGEDLRQTGLTPGSTYYIRGIYRGEIASETVKVTTYPIIELTNGNMEDWTAEEIGYYYNILAWKKNALRTYSPWTSNGQYWNTNNDFTTRHRDQWSPPLSTIYYYNSFPAVSYTKDVHNGTWAAELRNTAAGRGNTSSSSSSYDFNNVPGELFIGDISVTTGGTDASPSGDHYDINQGKEFNSRPTGIRFYYKYVPYTTDFWKAYIVLYDESNNIIAENTITDGNGTNTYTEVVMPFNYIDDPNIVPAKIYIYFASSIYSGSTLPYHSTNVTTWYGDSQRTDETLSGSALTIDDVSLIYDK